jgi:hypothetical protein
MLYTNCVNSGKLPRVHSVATMAIVAGLTSTLAAFEPEPDTSTARRSHSCAPPRRPPSAS